MNNIKKNTSKYWDYQLDNLLDQELFNETIKFHQSGVYKRKNCDVFPYSRELLTWLNNNEFSDNIPNHFSSELKLEVEAKKFQNSHRDFSGDRMSKKDFDSIIYNSFGRDFDSGSKRYPSAGALYPIVPLIYILENNAIEGLSNLRGCYVFDTYALSLKKIKEWSSEEFNDFLSVLNTSNKQIYSNFAIGYAIDLKKAIIKYKQRGYRHALIEIGLMAQALREVLVSEKKGLGEFCWSGFDDNALTYLSGLNPRLIPISLIQWFGYKMKGK